MQIFRRAEVVRRAERGIGLAIRKGQKDGGPYLGWYAATARQSIPKCRSPDENSSTLESPTKYLKRGNDMTQTYDVTDNVNDEQFEQVIESETGAVNATAQRFR